MSGEPIFSRAPADRLDRGRGRDLRASRSISWAAANSSGPDSVRRQHLLALRDRPRRHRRGAAAARHSGGQEPVQFAGQARRRQRAGDRRAARERRRRGERHRTLLKADTILLVLPKWTGLPSEQTSGLAARGQRTADAAMPQWALRLVAPRARGGARERPPSTGPPTSSTSRPTSDTPVQLMRGDRPAADHRRRAKACWWASSPSAIARSGCCRIPTSSPITGSRARAMRRWRSR